MFIEAIAMFFAGVVLCVIASYCGHLIWLGIRWLFSNLFMARECPKCGHKLNGQARCAVCEAATQSKNQRPTVTEDLQAAERLRQYARFQGWLDEAQDQYLSESLTRLRNRLAAQQPPSVAPLSTPVSSSPAAVVPETTPAIVPAAVIATATLANQPSINVATRSVAAAPVTHALDTDYEPVAATTTSLNGGVAALNSLAPAARASSSPPMPIQAEVLRSFMERSNIRWVELVSASLVVVCSVGLVISLWSTLSRTSRFFPSLVFMLATLAVHGAGQYTLSRWKLRTTSRGILHIGLMLIPLSVLVGILLAHRQGQQTAFEVNLGSVLAIGIGLAVYAGLAITAARALFAKYFMPIAACNILASAALVPIDVASQSSANIATYGAVTLMPVVLVSMIVSLLLTRQSAWRYRWTNAFARRHMGMAVQALFVTITACVFWFLKFKPLADISTESFQAITANWWWLAVGLMGVAWSAWGWAVSLARGSLAAHVSANQARYGAVKPIMDRDASWFIVVGWVLATMATLALAVGIWQANDSRLSMITLLAIGGAWWVVHGMFSRLSLPQLCGSLSMLLAMALGSETIRIGLDQPLSAIAWIGQERLTWMTLVGAVASALASAYVMLVRPRVSSASVIAARATTERIDQFMVKHVAMAGCVMMLAAAGLTVLASCLPTGATPYGGQWSAWYLGFYGVVLTVIGIGVERDARVWPSITAARWITPLILPVGLAVSILATIRFTQGSDWMPEWIIGLRPARAWSVGLTTLATLWALLAVALRFPEPRGASPRFNPQARRATSPTSSQQEVVSHNESASAPRPTISSIDWLNLAAICISVVSLLGVVRLSDHLDLVAKLYWQLPILCAAVCWSWRSANAREFTLLTSCAWCMASLYSIGQARQWWDTLPLFVSISSHVALGCIVCLMAGLLTRYWIVQRRASESVALAWLFQPIYWATALVVSSSLMAILIPLCLPALHNLGLSLGLIAELENNAPRLPLAFMKPSILQAMGVVGTIILWAFTAAFGSRLPQLAKLRLVVSLAPVMLTLILTATVPTAYALAVCLSVLSISLIASEVMTLFVKSWAQHSETSWQLLSLLQRDERAEANVLLMARILAVGSLFGLTGLAIFLGWDGRLAEHLLPAIDPLAATVTQERWSRLVAVIGWMWPAVAFLVVRWSLAVARDVGPGRVTLVGNVLAGHIACTASLLGMAAVIPWLYGSVAWLQWFVIVAAVLAGLSALATLLRNFMGLRAIDRGQTASLTLLSKAAGGGRWKRAVTSSHQLLRGALACMLALSVIAAVSNILVPIRALLSIDAVAVWPTWVGYVLLAIVLAWLWRSGEPRGQTHKWAGVASYAGLVALLLGMLAPIGAVFYADWLAAAPGRYAVGAQQFEPYRAQVVIWLAVLGIGLLMRLSTALQRWSVSGEVGWLVLAIIVGALAFVSSVMDPQPWWATSELAALAIIAVLSSCFAGQAWRGHIAAVLAGAACLTGCRPFVLDEIVDLAWFILIGPLLVGAISLAWQVFSRARASSDEALPDATGLSSPSTYGAVTVGAVTVDQSVSRHVPVVVCLLSCVWLFQRELGVYEFRWPVAAAVGIGAWLLSMARMWDVRRGGRGVGIYLSFVAASLTASVLVSYFNDLPLQTRSLMWMAFGLGALATVAGCLRQWQRESSSLIPALRLGKLAVKAEDFDAARRWLVPWHCTIGLVFLIPCVLLALALDQRVLRLANAALPLLSGLSILPIAIDARQRVSRAIGLWLISLPLVLFLWADLSVLTLPATGGQAWLYSQRAMVALVILGWSHWSLTQPLVGKLDWPSQLYLSSWISFVVAALAGTWMIVAEASDVWKVAAQEADLASQVVWLLAWAALIGRALQFALRPMGLDASASIKKRQLAVYAAELGMVMLAIATYDCFPKLFGGFFADWWPLIVYGIAMLSAGIGHWAAVNQNVVLADPVRRSSLLLPLIPLLGVWLPFSRQLAIDWSDWQSYSLVLISGAAMYALHGWLKPSVKLHTVAGVLALLAFWVLLHSRPSLRFFEHPQFWLVPPALATLIFVESNRRRLDASVVTAVRYVAILLAYLSSTSEILLKAFEGQMWQPLVLLLLAVMGVLAGIALRVRAFLFCGATFVMVALLGMVWHAQQAIDQVWPWWAFGILTGVSLIAMLGYFEKNRPRVLAYVERLKGWER